MDREKDNSSLGRQQNDGAAGEEHDVSLNGAAEIYVEAAGANLLDREKDNSSLGRQQYAGATGGEHEISLTEAAEIEAGSADVDPIEDGALAQYFFEFEDDGNIQRVKIEAAPAEFEQFNHAMRNVSLDDNDDDAEQNEGNQNERDQSDVVITCEYIQVFADCDENDELI